MKDKITPDILRKYFKISQEALSMARSAPRKKGAEVCLDMAARYIRDAEYFKTRQDWVKAYGALNYAHGWLDAGARLGLFEVHDDRLFTVDSNE